MTRFKSVRVALALSFTATCFLVPVVTSSKVWTGRWTTSFPRAEPTAPKNDSAYYTLRADRRRCAAPMCGGYFVKRVNQSTTRCADGGSKAECYVAEIEWDGQPSVDPNRALLRGYLTTKTFERFGKLGTLRVSEAWQAAGKNTPNGAFYRVQDRGVRCITHPCPTHRETNLNSTIGRDIAGVDLAQAGAPDDLVGTATAAMTEADGVLVSGSNEPVSGPAGKSLTLKATQFYLRPKNQVSKTKCRKTGCSGQVCADHDVMTTCIYRAEYECYKSAACEKQPDGNCGFTKTPELAACLKQKNPR